MLSSFSEFGANRNTNTFHCWCIALGKKIFPWFKHLLSFKTPLAHMPAEAWLLPTDGIISQSEA